MVFLTVSMNVLRGRNGNSIKRTGGAGRDEWNLAGYNECDGIWI